MKHLNKYEMTKKWSKEINTSFQHIHLHCMLSDYAGSQSLRSDSHYVPILPKNRINKRLCIVENKKNESGLLHVFTPYSTLPPYFQPPRLTTAFLTNKLNSFQRLTVQGSPALHSEHTRWSGQSVYLEQKKHLLS